MNLKNQISNNMNALLQGLGFLLQRSKDRISPENHHLFSNLPFEQQIQQTSIKDSNSGAGYSVGELAEGIKFAESRGEKSPYEFKKFSGKKELGLALGAYQITEARLKENAKKFLNRIVSTKEFLSSSKLQDQFIRADIQESRELGIPNEEIIRQHRGGYKAGGKEYQDYVNSVINSLKK
mgnify:CR=1 FL=1